MNWQSQYTSKTLTAEEAVKFIRSNQRIYLTGNCSVPHQLLTALINRAHELDNVEICQPLTVASSDYVSPDLEGHLRVNTLFISANVRSAVNLGRADFTPVLLSELPLLFKRKLIPVDVAFVHLSPPDENGILSFGIEAGLTRTIAENAGIIIAEVNPNMPRMLGDTLISIEDIDVVVPVDYPLSELPQGNGNVSPEVARIAHYIADIIPDGATLQTGIGEIPSTVLKFLHGKRDLGIHTELFSDNVIDLVERGVITNIHKKVMPGKIVAGFLLGTSRLYQWTDSNPLVELHRTEFVNSPFTIAQNPKAVAINSAIEIDLTGQVCADSIGTRLYSGVGGQMDFIYGSSLSEGGLPIIALTSTTTLSDGSLVSRIVPILKPGAGVTTSRNHVHYVATEYGIVDLYGKTIRQRVKLLVSIAHPDFRDGLLKKATDLNYI